jgi:hypothetical protein
LLLHLVDWEASPIVGALQTAIWDQEIAIFSETGNHHAVTWCRTRSGNQVKSRIKIKCVAKPEEHRGNALVALPEPLAYNHSPGTLRQTQKVQRMIRS